MFQCQKYVNYNGQKQAMLSTTDSSGKNYMSHAAFKVLHEKRSGLWQIASIYIPYVDTLLQF